MKWDLIAGSWKQWTGRARELWGRITYNDLEEIQGRYEFLVGKLQRRHAATRAKSAEELREWADSLSPTRRFPQSH